MKPFIVAEMSANHLGSLDRAADIIIAAGRAGADAVKFQTWKPDTMCVSDYKLTHGPWAGRYLKDLYREAHTPWHWHQIIFDHARKLGLIPFSAAFDKASVDFLETLGVDRHKVASFELTDIPLIRYMASKGKPMILSTGMATFNEAYDASVEAWDAGATGLTLLKCVSAYPSDPADANLACFQTGLASTDNKASATNADWGLSDHSLGIGVACAAAALGATMIEKHLTLKRSDGGPDAGFSMEPDEFKQLVTECRRSAAAIGTVKYGPGPHESTSLRRSLWVAKDIEPGEPLVLGDNIVTARPALGLPPSTNLTGKVASTHLKAGTPLEHL